MKRILIRNGYVVTVNSGRDVFDPGFVAINGEQIEAVGRAGREPAGPFDAEVDASEMIVVPVSNSLTVFLAPDDERGKYLGIFGLISSFGWFGSTFFGGLLYDMYQNGWMLWGMLAALGMTTGSPPSRTATTEFVVPRSIPTVFAIAVPPPAIGANKCAKLVPTYYST